MRIAIAMLMVLTLAEAAVAAKDKPAPAEPDRRLVGEIVKVDDKKGNFVVRLLEPGNNKEFTVGRDVECQDRAGKTVKGKDRDKLIREKAKVSVKLMLPEDAKKAAVTMVRFEGPKEPTLIKNVWEYFRHSRP